MKNILGKKFVKNKNCKIPEFPNVMTITESMIKDGLTFYHYKDDKGNHNALEESRLFDNYIATKPDYVITYHQTKRILDNDKEIFDLIITVNRLQLDNEEVLVGFFTLSTFLSDLLHVRSAEEFVLPGYTLLTSTYFMSDFNDDGIPLANMQTLPHYDEIRIVKVFYGYINDEYILNHLPTDLIPYLYGYEKDLSKYNNIYAYSNDLSVTDLLLIKEKYPNILKTVGFKDTIYKVLNLFPIDKLVEKYNVDISLTPEILLNLTGSTINQIKENHSKHLADMLYYSVFQTYYNPLPPPMFNGGDTNKPLDFILRPKNQSEQQYQNFLKEMTKKNTFVVPFYFNTGDIVYMLYPGEDLSTMTALTQEELSIFLKDKH